MKPEPGTYRGRKQREEIETNQAIHVAFIAALLVAAACVVVMGLQVVFFDRSQPHSGVPLLTPPRMVPVGGFAFLLAGWLFCQEHKLDPLFEETEEGRKPRIMGWFGLIFYIGFVTLAAIITRLWWA